MNHEDHGPPKVYGELVSILSCLAPFKNGSIWDTLLCVFFSAGYSFVPSMPVTRSQASALARESQVICEISGYEYLLSADYHARFNPYIKPPLTDNTTRTAPSRSFRESTESTEEHPDSLALTLAFSTPPRSVCRPFTRGLDLCKPATATV